MHIYKHTLPDVKRACPVPSAQAAAAARVFSSLNVLNPGAGEEERAQARLLIG